ncbi:hypothetical protein ABEB36_009395 [Hypothenemus hampei]|uniref:Uncharacterized protein n=1 Tax=Hypothenemus hampei TaxID=57062 RepID=A0ABD1EG82_HYPHA
MNQPVKKFIYGQTLVITMYDPRPLATVGWLSKYKYTLSPKKYIVEEKYSGPLSSTRLITKCLVEKLKLEPNTNHYHLMWKCAKKAIRHAIYTGVHNYSTT